MIFTHIPSSYFCPESLDKRNFVNIFLPISFNIRFGCSKEPSHWHSSLEYPQHMFWLRNKKIIFLIALLTKGLLQTTLYHESKYMKADQTAPWEQPDLGTYCCLVGQSVASPTTDPGVPSLIPGPVPYIRGDWSWNNFYGHSPPSAVQEGLLLVTSRTIYMKYWLIT